MQANRKSDRKKYAAVGLGCMISVAIGIAGIMLTAKLMLEERVEQTQTDIFIYGILLISAFVGSLVAKLFSNTTQLPIPIGVSAIYACILLISGMLVFDGGFVRPWNGLVMLGCGCGISCMISKKKRARGVRQKRAPR